MPNLDSLRVLVVAPIGKDAALIVEALHRAGVPGNACADIQQVSELLSAPDIGALLVTEEALTPGAIRILSRALAPQPAWSDLPVLILTAGGTETQLTREREDQRMELGSTTLLERPIRMATLISSVKAAIRARRRQYEVRDILEQKDRAEASLGTAEQRLQLALEAARLGAWELNLKTGALAASPICRHDFGLPPDETPSFKRLLARIAPEDRSGLEAKAKEAIEAGNDYRAEYRVHWPDGSTHWIYITGRAIGPANAPVERMVGVTLDITERVLSEEALRKSEKLALVGRLASSIAHEINNPLEAVTNLLYLLRSTRMDADQQIYLQMAEQELARVSEIASQTLSFNRQRNIQGRAAMAKLLDSVLALYQGRLSNSHIQVERRYQGTADIACYPGELRQVLTNLIGNAFDAMRQGGRILVRERRATDASTGRQGVRITVADTGMGISPDMQQRLFEPFHSTKGNNGTGLGLWISRGIVSKHGGRIRCRSSIEPGRSGSVFSVFIPAVQSEMGSTAA